MKKRTKKFEIGGHLSLSRPKHHTQQGSLRKRKNRRKKPDAMVEKRSTLNFIVFLFNIKIMNMQELKKCTEYVSP